MADHPTGQVFTWGAWRWDVDAALALVAAAPRTPTSVPVAPWMALMGAMRVDPGHAAQADLDKPLIAVPFLGASMIIDGWHRLWRADAEGREALPVYLLSEAEERRIRLSTGGGRPRRRA